MQSIEWPAHPETKRPTAIVTSATGRIDDIMLVQGLLPLARLMRNGVTVFRSAVAANRLAASRNVAQWRGHVDVEAGRPGRPHGRGGNKRDRGCLHIE